MRIDRVHIKELGPWLAEPKSFWLGISMIVGAVVVDWIAIGICPRVAEPTIRWTGRALQLFGIGTVAWGCVGQPHNGHSHRPATGHERSSAHARFLRVRLKLSGATGHTPDQAPARSPSCFSKRATAASRAARRSSP